MNQAVLRLKQTCTVCANNSFISPSFMVAEYKLQQTEIKQTQ